MVPNNFLEKEKKELEKIVSNFKDYLLTLRTNRPHPALVEEIMVACYETKMPLKSLASISINLPRTLLIQPFDPNILDNIAKAIESSPLGLNPSKEKNVIRLNLPPLTEEKRQELTKIVRQKEEQSKILIRQKRDEILEEINKAFERKEISEDEKFKMKENLQKEISDFNKKIEELAEEKIKEIMTV